MDFLLYIGTHGKLHGLEPMLTDRLEHGEILAEKVEDSNVEPLEQQPQQLQSRVEQVLDIELLLLSNNNHLVVKLYQ